MAILTGYTVFDMTDMGVSDAFAIAAQVDTAGDVARVTPWNHQRDLTITFYPVHADLNALDLPVPMSKVTITGRADLPLPRAFAGDWRYVGPGEIMTTNRGLMVMRLGLKKWNPLYGQTITPTP